MAKNIDLEREQKSKEDRAAGVTRMLTGQEAPVVTPPNEYEPSTEVGGASTVGESITRRGEDVVGEDGKEAGRKNAANDATPAARPSGTSTARDATGVNPQEGVTDSPPMGGQGG